MRSSNSGGTTTNGKSHAEAAVTVKEAATTNKSASTNKGTLTMTSMLLREEVNAVRTLKAPTAAATKFTKNIANNPENVSFQKRRNNRTNIKMTTEKQSPKNPV